LCLLTGLLFGLAPVWQSFRADLNSTLKEAAGRSGGRQRLQSAWCFRTASLFCCWWRGADDSHAAEAGHGQDRLRAENVVTSISAFQRLALRQPPKVRELFRQVTDRMESAPGIESAALTTNV